MWRALDGSTMSLSLGASGAASYAATLVSGRYVAEYESGVSACTADNAPLCGTELLVGCD